MAESEIKSASTRRVRRINKAKAAASQEAADPRPVHAGTQRDGREASHVFLGAVVVGFGFALLGLIDNQVLHWLGFIAPIAATLAYPIWGYIRGFHTRPSLRERFADNCYYLGFIFTQIALVVGFLPVAVLNDEIGSQDVLRFFGMALGASLTGLLARTLLTQTGHTVAENADIVEGEVEALAHRVSRQAGQVLKEFEGLTNALTASQRRLNEEFAGSISTLTRTIADYDSAFKRDARLVEAGAAGVIDASNQTVAGLNAHQETLATSLISAAGAIESLKRNLDSQVGETNASIRATATALATGLTSLQNVSALSERVERVDASLGKIGDQVELLGGAFDRGSIAAESSIRGVQELVDETRARAVESTQALSKEMTETVAELEKTLVAFRSELERLRV